jgi:hypothetical protein
MKEAGSTGLSAFKTTLNLLRAAADGTSVPGLKAAVGTLLAVLEGIDVCLLIHSRAARAINYLRAVFSTRPLNKTWNHLRP